MIKPLDVDHYVKEFPTEIQILLEQMRGAIKSVVPDAVESISYGMPAYKSNGKPLVYFAGFKNHIGFYATPSGHTSFAAELSGYKRGKGSVQFPVDQPLPIDLILRIVRFRVEENNQKK